MWIKAQASNSSGNCVEMEELPTPEGGVRVRDSKDPSGPVLSFTNAEFRAWLDGAKAGEYDHLI